MLKWASMKSQPMVLKHFNLKLMLVPQILTDLAYLKKKNSVLTISRKQGLTVHWLLQHLPCMQDILQQEPLEWLAVVELWPHTVAGTLAAQGTLVVLPGRTLADCIQCVPWMGHNPGGTPQLGDSHPGRGHLEGLLHNLHLSKEINILYCIVKIHIFSYL